MSTNEANRSYYERSKEQKERAKKIKSPDIRNLYGYEDKHNRMKIYCKNKTARDKKLRERRKAFPEYVFIEINPVENF